MTEDRPHRASPQKRSAGPVSAQLAIHTHPIDSVRGPFHKVTSCNWLRMGKSVEKLANPSKLTKQVCEGHVHGSSHVNSPAFTARQDCPFCRTPDPSKWRQCVSRTLESVASWGSPYLFCRTPDPSKWRQCVSRTNPLFRVCGLVRPTYLEAAWKHVDMNMLSTLDQTKGRTNIRTES